jgi:nitrite reductase/ring-hydroxylating ferredoxin subunit
MDRRRIATTMSGSTWIAVTTLDELAEHRGARVMVGDQPVMLYRDADRIWAIGAKCTHQGAPLERGRVKIGGSLVTVTCPAHGSMFNLVDGSVVKGPAHEAVPAFEARIVGESVELRPR